MIRAVRAWLPRLNSRRSRRLASACLATLGVSGALLGIVVFLRWQTAHAVQGDTRVILNQAGDQLIRAFSSRRGTLTLLRDMLDKAPDLNTAEHKALAKSAVAHTRHLLGVGLLRSDKPLVWWTTPSPITHRERSRVNRVVAQQARSRTTWRAPATMTVVAESNRPLLVMTEPLRANATRSGAIVGLFDLQPLLGDFFELTLQQPYPVQLLDANHVVYRSAHWQLPTDRRRPIVLERPITLDAVQWLFQMQPGTTRIVRTISIFHVTLAAFGALAGLAMIGLIWVLAMRTWILQRAVVRRTAALRRTTERLRQLAITDELTGLYNRRYFLERWQWEHERATRYGRELSCLMIDVDGFKQVNDSLGHAAGDLVLTQVAQELKAQLRQADILARFGGDEFIVALPETGVARASAVAEKLRGIAIHGPWTTHPEVGPVRLSVGVSHIRDHESPQQLIQHADKALYASRRASRSRRLDAVNT